jgi:hypothetical protein
MAGFLKDACAVTSYNSSDNKKMDFPRYAILFDGRDGQVDEWTDTQHSMEVGSGIAYGYYLSLLLGTPDTSMLSKAKSLYVTYDDGVNGWIRPSGPAGYLPAYRVSPWRKYNWEYRPSGGFSWAIDQSGNNPALIGNIKPESRQSLQVTGIAASFGSIAIQFSTAHQTALRISMYRPDGRMMTSSIINNLAAGFHRVHIDASKTAHGLYIVKISSGDKSCIAPVFLAQ